MKSAWLADLASMFSKAALETFNIWQGLPPFSRFQDMFLKTCFHLFRQCF